MRRKKTTYQKFKGTVRRGYRDFKHSTKELSKDVGAVTNELTSAITNVKTGLRPIKKGSDKMVGNLKEAFLPQNKPTLVRYVEMNGAIYAQLSDGQLVYSQKYN